MRHPRRTRAILPVALLMALVALSVTAQTWDGKDIAVFAAESRRAFDFGTRLAVVVGIDRYGKGLTQLNYAEKDARDVATALTRGGWSVTLMTMHPAEAPNPFFAEDILAQVRKMAAQADAADTVLFFFSGHGFNDATGENYLCANQTDPKALPATGLRLSEIRSRLESGKARRRMVIVDACRNIPGKSAGESPGFSSKELVATQGTGLLFSTEPEFRSFEPLVPEMKDHTGSPIRNGLFSHYVLAGLAGAADSNEDGAITFRELGYFVGASMKRLCLKQPEVNQKPYLSWIGGASDDFYVADVAPVSRPAPGTPEEGVPRRELAWATVAPATAYDEKSGLPKEVVDRGSGIEMVLIHAGTFTMGASPGDPEAFGDEEPAHRVTISEPFYMGKYEVTNGEYRRYKADHDSGKYEDESLNGDRQPVTRVSWDDARAYCARFGLRLPTEAEWEYACRGGTTTRYPWGDDPAAGERWANAADQAAKRKWASWSVFSWDDGYAVAAPVGRFRANGFGLHDMIGNVREWCADWYGEREYESRGGGAVDPRGPSNGEYGALRGGSWFNDPRLCRSSSRIGFDPSTRNVYFGFRAARSP